MCMTHEWEPLSARYEMFLCSGRSQGLSCLYWSFLFKFCPSLVNVIDGCSHSPPFSTRFNMTILLSWEMLSADLMIFFFLHACVLTIFIWRLVLYILSPCWPLQIIPTQHCWSHRNWSPRLLPHYDEMLKDAEFHCVCVPPLMSCHRSIKIQPVCRPLRKQWQ